MMFCHLRIDLDDTTHAVTRVESLDKESIIDPGWTPFFKMRHWPPSAMSIFEGNMKVCCSWSSYPGELSDISKLCVDERHPRSAQAVRTGRKGLSQRIGKIPSRKTHGRHGHPRRRLAVPCPVGLV